MTLAGDTSVEKSVTVTCKSAEAPKPRPLLLADALTDDAPKPQVIVEPGDVPQSPDQVSVVSPQPLGSTKPS